MRRPRYFVTVFWLVGLMPATMAQSASKDLPIPVGVLQDEVYPSAEDVERAIRKVTE